MHRSGRYSRALHKDNGEESKGRESKLLKAGIQMEVFIWYDSAALIGTIVAWLKNDMPYTPAFLAKQIYLIHNRAWNKVEEG
ncbi:TetR-like C-terminal domain-containing protein [Halalkalibacter oceani]|uniref:TetR family transcriptional regulator C-terminal domain-containing protein n=1 Tax=Halalkalibacter oceani TaxID=1653776 RepID=A0A9X2DT21_9BACI|nr:TetR-like C-terminal domain-containing protein [Halalkalibacter oceani]MCM3716176.1 TetR family transcriptional regulator C-terminal domain-containing protein [Halalkalibacter oceani]MCM3761782.1 TetR family transcriptional regulator C-terminal domain-containing protein [Halalkalibacter oceani]